MTQPIPDAALEADIAVLGQKGAGKTYTLKGRVERLLDLRRRVVILDPLNSWWGLKARADGSPGYPIAVIGGPNADVPLDPTRGEALGEFVAGANLSVVLDVSELSRGKMIAFATAFLGALYRHTREALWLVLEEADVFAPQSPMGDQVMMLHQVDQIARRGRARGLRLWTVTQRPARLHKDVLTQISTLVALRLRAPQDREAVKAWVEGNADRDAARAVIDQLASLPTGEGFVWAPDLDLLQRVKFPLIKTLDTSSTPKAGEVRASAKMLAKADVGALAAIMAPAPETEPAPGREARTAVADLQAAEQRGFDRGFIEGEARGQAKGQAVMLTRAQAALNALRVDAVQALRVDGAAPAARAPAPQPLGGQPERAPKGAASAAQRRADAAPAPGQSEGSAALTAPQSRVLEALSFWRGLGIEQPTRIQVGCAAGYSPSSGGFANILGTLRGAGLLDYPAPGAISLTPAGVERGRGTDERPVMERVHSVLSSPQSKVLAAVLDAGGDITREALAAVTGYSATSGGFANLLGALRSLGLVDYPAKGAVRAAGWLT